jgi:hypothetical protein
MDKWYACTKTTKQKVKAPEVYEFIDKMIPMYSANTGCLMTYKSNKVIRIIY